MSKTYHKQLYELTPEKGFNGTGWEGVRLSLEEVLGLISEYRELKKQLKETT